jgi:hypothetical protein
MKRIDRTSPHVPRSRAECEGFKGGCFWAGSSPCCWDDEGYFAVLVIEGGSILAELYSLYLIATFFALYLCLENKDTVGFVLAIYGT